MTTRVKYEEYATLFPDAVVISPSTSASSPVHTYPDIFESATLSFWIRLPSTRLRWIRHTNPQLFESALQSGNFVNCYESEIVWTLNPDFFNPRWCRAQCYRFFTSWTSVSILITCVKLNWAIITVHFNNTKRRLDILRHLLMSDGQIGRLKQVKRAKLCSVWQFCQRNKYWRRLERKFSYEPMIASQISWRGESESGYVWTGKFDLNTEMCGRGNCF